MKTNGNPFIIFLVDDDKLFLSSLMHKLNERFKTEIKIITFTTGEDCLKELYLDPDIIILDHYLNSEYPDAINGIQVLKKIKSENNNATVVMLSSQDKLEVAAESIKYGAFEYVVKTESSFIRTENVVKNILSNKNIEGTQKKYEIWNYIIAFLLLGLIVLDVVYYINH